MSESLRAGLVEAMAHAFYEADDCYRDSWESQPEEGVRNWYREMSAIALDAALHTLEQRSVEWEDLAGDLHNSGYWYPIPKLIAALSDSRDTERPEVPDMSTKREDLYVMGVATSGRTIRESRPATTADLVASLIAEGGEIVPWCEEHHRFSPHSVTYCNIETAKFPFRSSCRMVERLVFPIPVESAEAKET